MQYVGIGVVISAALGVFLLAVCYKDSEPRIRGTRTRCDFWVTDCAVHRPLDDCYDDAKKLGCWAQK